MDAVDYPLVQRARRLVKTGLKRLRRPPRPPADLRNDSAVRNGVVETFSRKLVSGWITVDKGAAPVRISLKLADLEVAATWSTGVSDGIDRTTYAEVRGFRFWLKDVWDYTAKGTRLTVHADGRLLPIASVGMYRTPQRPGAKTVEELKEQLDAGYVFDQYGTLQLSKNLDTEWQKRSMALFTEIRTFVRENLGYDVFFVYGTLLGAVRDNGFIGHDIDMDCGYISRHTDGRQAAIELRDLAFKLIDAGYVVESFWTHLHVTDRTGTRIDIFHIFFGPRGVMKFPFGIAGTSVLSRNDWRGVKEIDFGGGTGVIPVNAEKLVAHLYGADWRRPKPGFHWPADRTTRAPGGIMTRAMNEEVYWANFYAHVSYDSGSTFQAAVEARPDTPPTVIDIGCGDGRDSYTFGRAGRTVVGIDRSHIGVQHATKHAEELGLSDRVSFRSVDVSDVEATRAVFLETLAASGDSPVLFYMRFFLHSIPEEVQAGLMGVIRSVARPGDMLAAEFRTDKDAKLEKVHGGHYRRYQSGPEFGQVLRDRLGFEVLHEEEGTGLSPYKDEDPELYRVIARRPTA